jgi:hypothetical protein
MLLSPQSAATARSGHTVATAKQATSFPCTTYLPGREAEGFAGRPQPYASVLHAWQGPQADVLVGFKHKVFIHFI